MINYNNMIYYHRIIYNYIQLIMNFSNKTFNLSKYKMKIYNNQLNK